MARLRFPDSKEESKVRRGIEEGCWGLVDGGGKSHEGEAGRLAWEEEAEDGVASGSDHPTPLVLPSPAATDVRRVLGSDTDRVRSSYTTRSPSACSGAKRTRLSCPLMASQRIASD